MTLAPYEARVYEYRRTPPRLRSRNGRHEAQIEDSPVPARDMYLADETWPDLDDFSRRSVSARTLGSTEQHVS